MLLLGRCFGSATKDVREKIYKDHGSKTDSLKTEKIKQKQKQTGSGRRRPSEQRLQRQAAVPVSAERRGSVTPPSAGKLEFRVEKVTNQSDRALELIRHLPDTIFGQLLFYGPSKNQVDTKPTVPTQKPSGRLNGPPTAARRSL